MHALLMMGLTAPVLPPQGELPGDAAAVRAVAAGDLDADGNIDLVFAIEGAVPRVLLGKGGGDFELADDRLPPDPINARDVAMFDADGDGDLDLAIACYRAGNGIYENDGKGNFTLRHSLEGQPSAWTTSVAVADIDADGDIDVAFGNLGQPTELYINDGGRFIEAPKRIPSVSERTACLEFADIDGDGDLDLVCGNRPDMSKRGGSDHVFRNDNGVLTNDSKAHRLAAKFHTLGVVIADLDGDGDQDLVAAHSSGKGESGVRNTIHVYKKRFLAGNKRRIPDTKSRSNAVAGGDFDRDGDIDVVFANEGENRLFVNDGAATFIAKPAGIGSHSARTVDVLAVDLDRDGLLDLVFANDGSACRAFYGDGAGNFSARAATGAVAAPSPNQPDSPNVAAARPSDSSVPSEMAKWLEDLANDDEWRAERAAHELASRGRDAVPSLLEAIPPEPGSLADYRRARYAALALTRIGDDARGASEDLVELLDEACLAKATRIQTSHVVAIADVLAAVAPFAVADGFEIRAALDQPRQQKDPAFARAIFRTTIAADASIEELAQGLDSDNPWVRELAAELCAHRASECKELAARLSTMLGSDHPQSVAYDFLHLKGSHSTSNRDRISDHVAAALIAIGGDPDRTLAAHIYLLRRSSTRWHGPHGAHLRRAATRSARALGRDATAARTALEGILQPGFPLALSNDEELALVHAALEALARLGTAAAGSIPVVEPLVERAETRAAATATLRALRGDSGPGKPGQPGKPSGKTAPDLKRIAGGMYAKRIRGRADLRSRSAARAIKSALNWLAAHQDDDGKWDPAGFMRHDTSGAPCTGPGQRQHTVGVTGLVLLCFLADGSTPTYGEFSDSVARGIAWLVSQTASDGLVGTGKSNDYIYGQAIATLALAEAWGMSNDPDLEPVVRRAAQHIIKARNPNTGWRYQPRAQSGDTSVTAWCISALAAAADFGMEVPEEEFAATSRFFASMTDNVIGRIGYTSMGGRSARLPGKQVSQFPSELGEAMTGAGLFGSIRAGDKPTKVTLLQEQLFTHHPPTKAPNARDFYYWFWASQALRQLGGAAWRDWQKQLVSVLIPLQQKRSNASGSWDPDGAWGEPGGRLSTTALATRALQAECRFARAIDPRWRLLAK